MLAWRIGALALLTGCGEEPPPEATAACPGLDDVPDDAVYVKPGGDGDGSSKSPLGDIVAALDAAMEAASRTVILKPGTYVTDTIVLDSGYGGFQLRGTCTDTVILDMSKQYEALGDEQRFLFKSGAITLNDHRTRGGQASLIEGLTIAGAGVGVLTSGDTTVTLRGVDITGSRNAGVLISGPGTVRVEDATIRDADPDHRTPSYGVYMAHADGELTLDGVTISDMVVAAVQVGLGELTMQDVRIERTTPNHSRREESIEAGEWYGAGVIVQEAQSTLSEVTITDSVEVGVWMKGGRATMAGVEISHTATEPEHQLAAGILMEAARLSVSDSTLAHNDFANILSVGGLDPSGTILWPSHLTITDSVLRDAGSTVLGSPGFGLSVTSTNLTVSGTDFRDNLLANLLLVDLPAGLVAEELGIRSFPNTTVYIAQSTVGDVRPMATDDVVAFYARMAAAVDDNGSEGGREAFRYSLGRLASQPQSTVSSGALIGYGGATLEAVSFSGEMDVAVTAVGSEVTLNSVDITDTTAERSFDGDAAGGITGYESTLLASDLLIRGIDGTGISLQDSRAYLDDVHISQTRDLPLGARYGESDPQGLGILSARSELWLWDATIEDVLHMGLSVFGGSATLRDVDVRRVAAGQFSFGFGVYGLRTELDALRLSVADVDGIGISRGRVGGLRCEQCDVHDNGFAGILSFGDLTLRDSTVTGTLPHRSAGGGFGVMSLALTRQHALPWATGVLDAGTVLIEGTTIGPHAQAALFIEHAPHSTAPSRQVIRDSELHAETPPTGDDPVWPSGNAIFAHNTASWDAAEGEGLLVEDSVLYDSGAGEGTVFLHGASAVLDAVQTEGAVGVFQQGRGVSTAPSCEALSVPTLSETDATLRRCPGFDELVELPKLSLLSPDNAL